MRSLYDSGTRWQRTVKRATDLADFKLSVRSQGDESPCISGLRSVYWKIFLLFHTSNTSIWPGVLEDARGAYSSLREHYLRYLERPDELDSASDPLDDDKTSPWNILRQDEELRAEIYLDVERCMPEEHYFRQASTQRILLDILFIFCKMNPDVGYRQGMHELLAPVLWVVEKDAVDPADTEKSSTSYDQLIIDTLDASYIEHDSFTIFSLLMQSAKSFYELGEPEKRSVSVAGPGSTHNGASPIVDRSKRIHEVYLARVDPELADHLTTIEVLPQIFLIRWIRILFGREFPFDSLLSLWDTIFAEDPALDLVDMICVAMLLRIRWQLLEADYSVALTLLLKYPFPELPYGPQTFVEDAIYLRENFTTLGAKKLITTYSGKSPLPYTYSRPATPSIGGLDLEHKVSLRRSPLPSSAPFLQQGRVEALIQGAAKGVFERGERLGINKAVRDAVGEVKKNMQNLQSQSPPFARRSSDTVRCALNEARTVPPRMTAATMVASMKERNKQLSRMLSDALNDLRKFSTAEENATSMSSSTVDLAIAKIQFVQVYLDDSSMPLPSRESEDSSTEKKPSPDSIPPSISSQVDQDPPQKSTDASSSEQPKINDTVNKNNTERLEETDSSSAPKAEVLRTSSPISTESSRKGMAFMRRPRAPVPTRSSIAQSSFAFMLEPNESSSSTAKSSSPKTSSPFLAQGKQPLSGSSREKSKAFLFGDEIDDDEQNLRQTLVKNGVEEEFNLGSITAAKDR